MTRAWSIALLLLLVGCNQPTQKHKEGVGDVLGLEFGVPLDLKIKKGPTDPPDDYAYLKEYYEVEFPNKEFDSVGVAVTKNSEKNDKAGLVFAKERLIWGAVFNKNRPCEEEDYQRIKAFLAENWEITIVKEWREGIKASPILKGSFTSPYAVWKLSCAKGSLGLDLAVTDYSAIRKAGNESTKKSVDKIVAKMNKDIQQKAK